MEENTKLFGALLEKIEIYSKTSIDLIKLKAIDQLSKVLSNAVFGIIVSLLAFLFLLFLNLAIAFWLNDLLGVVYAGFFIIAGFYFLAIIILIVFNKQIIRTPLIRSIISKFLN